MRTISRHRPNPMAPLDHRTMCDICGVAYHRSDLRRDRSGNLACDRDYGGDVVSITEENATRAQEPLVTMGVWDSGGFEPVPVETPPTRHYPDGKGRTF